MVYHTTHSIKRKFAVGRLHLCEDSRVAAFLGQLRCFIYSAYLLISIHVPYPVELHVTYWGELSGLLNPALAW